MTKILYYRFLLLDQFRFGETHFTTYQRSWPITMRIVHSWAVNNENGFFCGKLPLKIKNLTGLCHKERTSFLYWRIFAACACGWISCDIMRYHAISCYTTCFQQLTRSWCCSPVCSRALSVHASLVMHEALANVSSLFTSSVRDVVGFRQASHSHLCDMHRTRVRCENALGHVPVVAVVLQVVVL